MERAADALVVAAFGSPAVAPEKRNAGGFDRITLWALTAGMHAEERKARTLVVSSLGWLSGAEKCV